MFKSSAAGAVASICLAASLGPLNWERWGYGCILGILLFSAYGVVEFFYNRCGLRMLAVGSRHTSGQPPCANSLAPLQKCTQYHKATLSTASTLMLMGGPQDTPHPPNLPPTPHTPPPKHTRKHGPPIPGSNHDDTVYDNPEPAPAASAKDIEVGACSKVSGWRWVSNESVPVGL